jgi:hypothetical protein
VALRPELAGQILMFPTGNEQYWIDTTGVKRHIADTPTRNGVFQGEPLATIWDVKSIDDGLDIADYSLLAKSPNDNRAYFIDVALGQKRWIVSQQAMDKYHFERASVQDVPHGVLMVIPDGPELG